MEEMTNIIPSMRFDEFKYSWKVTTLGEITRQYRESNKNVHHQNLLSLSYGKIVRKDIESKKGLLPASFDTYQIIKKDIIVFRVTDLQNDKKSQVFELAYPKKKASLHLLMSVWSVILEL